MSDVILKASEEIFTPVNEASNEGESWFNSLLRDKDKYAIKPIKSKICIFHFENLNKLYKKITKTINTLEGTINENDVKTNIETYVRETLGFEPTIKVLYDILFKHLHCFSETFLSILNSCEKEIITLKSVTDRYNIITDVPLKYSNNNIPPFPMIAVNGNSGYKMCYPGEYTFFLNRPEVILTEEIYNKLRKFNSEVEEAKTKINENFVIENTEGFTESFNFFADLRTDPSLDGRKNYQILTHNDYSDYNSKQKAELIRDIFLSRLVTYTAMYYVKNGETFSPNEANLLHVVNPLLLKNDETILEELEAMNLDELNHRYEEFVSFSNQYKRGFINYFPGAESKDDEELDYKVIHKNGNIESSCWLIDSGTQAQLERWVERFKDNEFFAVVDTGSIDVGPEVDYDINKRYLFYRGKDLKKTIAAMGKDYHFIKFLLFNYDNEDIEYSQSNCRFINTEIASNLFDNYTINLKGNETGHIGTRDKLNNIVYMNMSQVLQLGEFIYISNNNNFTYMHSREECNIYPSIPASASEENSGHMYYYTTIENTSFEKFLYDEYVKFLNDNSYFNEEKKYIIAKNWMYNNVDTKIEGGLKVVWDKFISSIKINNNLNPGVSLIEKKENYEKRQIERLEIKTSIYYTLKNLYDKWYSSMNKNFFTYNNMSSNVKYYDTLSRDIGNSLGFDIYKFVNQIISFTSADGTPSDVISFMAQTAQANNCNFIVLPQYSDISLDEMFKPHSFYNGEIKHNPYGASYIVMHNGNVSHHLDIVGGDYPNDGFDIANYYGNDLDDFTKNISNSSHMVAFGVTYGMQNQNIFRSISVDTKTPSVSDYSIANTLLIADSAGQANHVVNNLNSQFLFPVYANRSYECTVEMMGCANIRPLMYFQLNNIPMFRGAYIITNVTHRITPNDFSTTFTGTRVSKYNIPIFDKTMSYSTFISLFDKRMEENKESANANINSGKIDAKKSVVKIDYKGDLCFDLYRFYYNENVTLGKLVLNGEFLCYTLEDRVRFTNEESEEMHGLKNQVGTGKGKYAAFKVYGKDARPGHTDETEGLHAIPSNKNGYTLTPGRMSKLGERPLIINVPCFSGVFMHEGTSQWNSSGCILLGESVNKTTETLNYPNSITAYVAGLVKGATGTKTLKIHQSEQIKRKESGDVIATIDGKKYYDIDFTEKGFIEVDWTIEGTEVSELKKHTRIETKTSETCSEDGYNNNKDKYLEKLQNTTGYCNVYEYINENDSTLLDYIDFDLRYTTVHNFMGEKMYGNIPQGKEGAFLEETTCKKLLGTLRKIRDNKKYNIYKLVILDAARPSSVSHHMSTIVNDTRYAASCKKSKHNKGTAIDVTLKHKSSNTYVDMGPYLVKGNITDTNYDINKSFDLFHPVSTPNLIATGYTGTTVSIVDGKINKTTEVYILTESHVELRNMLKKDIMSGWSVAKTEWWHFTNSSGSEKLLDF